MCGLPWMNLSIQDAINAGVIKSVDKIKLDNDSKKAFKEGVLLDSSLSYVTNQIPDDPEFSIAKKILERETFSGYVFPPLKRGFRSFVRITGLVLLVSKKFKQGMVAARSKRNLPVSDGSTMESFDDPPVKFSVFMDSWIHG